jgi:hypothetical protein
MGSGAWRIRHAGCADDFPLLASPRLFWVLLAGVLEDGFDITRAIECLLLCAIR